MNKRQKALLEAALICFILAMALIVVITTINAEKAPPQDYQWSIFWGETAHVLCYESADKQAQHQPSGILNFDVTDSGVVTISCREPGTDKGE